MVPPRTSHLEDLWLQDHIRLLREGHLGRQAAQVARPWTARLAHVYLREPLPTVLV